MTIRTGKEWSGRVASGTRTGEPGARVEGALEARIHLFLRIAL